MAKRGPKMGAKKSSDGEVPPASERKAKKAKKAAKKPGRKGY